MSSPAGEREFFQTLRVILNDARRAGSTKASLGQGERLEAEPARLKVATGMRFPSAEMVDVQIPETGRAQLTVAFMGLTGPSGVLPDHYSELLVARRRERDTATADFFDLFNHRALSLFYRAWARSRLPVRFEEAGNAFHDPVSRLLGAVIGLGLDGQHAQASRENGAVLGLAGRLGRRVRSAGALQSLVASLTPIACKVEEFHGRWLSIPPTEQTRLARVAPGLKTFSQLGVDAVTGDQVWDAQGRFRLRLGPMSLKDFMALFRPDGPRAVLASAVRDAVGPALAFDFRLVLRRDEVPLLRLGDDAMPAHLGQTTWLCSSRPDADRDDAVLSSDMSY